MINRGAPARASRRSAAQSRPLLVSLIAAGVLAAAPVATAQRTCTETGDGWCVLRRIVSEAPQGELGFRFGAPRDVDGDGVADVAAGARYTLRGVHQNGMAAVWSGATGSRLRAWAGEFKDGLFGHAMLALPDLDGDGRADVVISAPNAVVDGFARGVLVARSPRSGAEIWRRDGEPDQNFGWDLAPTGDHDGDGVADLFVGAPGRDAGRAYLIGGKNGAPLRTFAPRRDEPSFGWYVAAAGDQDGDGRDDVAIGAHLTKRSDGAMLGAAYVYSSASGEMLREWRGNQGRSGFGEVVATLGDLDGDGVGEIVVSAPRTNDRTKSHAGEVFVYSGASGAAIHNFTGKQPGEIYGRMIASAGDVDGDGSEDLAVGAPWHRGAAGERVGRVEIRSSKSGEVLAELTGDTANAWFGWHIVRAPDPEKKDRPALLIASLRHPINKVADTGVIDWYVLEKTGGEGR